MNRGTYVEKNLKTILDCQCVPITVFGNGLTFDQFHHKVRHALFGGASIVQAGNVVMIETGQDLPFLLEPADHKMGIQTRANQFQGDLFAILIVGPKSSINLAHTAGADERDNLVSTQATAYHPGRLWFAAMS